MTADRSPALAKGAVRIPDGPAFGRRVRAVTEGAVPGDGLRCPVARACLEVWPGCEPHIDGDQPHVILADGSRRDLQLGQDLVAEIGRFDREEGGFGDGVVIEFVGWVQ